MVDELDSREEINYIHKILEMGTGADRQLRVFEETGDLKKVVDYIIEETEVGLTREAGSRLPLEKQGNETFLSVKPTAELIRFRSILNLLPARATR